MKFLRIEPIEVLYIKTDDPEYPYHRRSKAGHWEVLMGESWEPAFKEEELEAEFQRVFGYEYS
jgi:hypothetical protein